MGSILAWGIFIVFAALPLSVMVVQIVGGLFTAWLQLPERTRALEYVDDEDIERDA